MSAPGDLANADAVQAGGLNSASVLQRITHLTAPPVIGQRYLVPTVAYPWPYTTRRNRWPVFPIKHDDGEHLNFPWPHYHVDPRFLAPSAIKLVAKNSSSFWDHPWDLVGRAEAVTQRAPLQRLDDAGKNIPHPPIVWCARRCYRSAIGYQHAEQAAIRKLNETFAGRQCRHGRAGWVCPHKRFPLGSIAPDAEGFLTCPLHGLRINADTGLVADGAPMRQERNEAASNGLNAK